VKKLSAQRSFRLGKFDAAMSWKEKNSPPAGASICDSALPAVKDRRREDGPMLSIFADDWMPHCAGLTRRELFALAASPGGLSRHVADPLGRRECASLPRQRPPTIAKLITDGKPIREIARVKGLPCAKADSGRTGEGATAQGRPPGLSARGSRSRDLCAIGGWREGAAGCKGHHLRQSG